MKRIISILALVVVALSLRGEVSFAALGDKTDIVAGDAFAIEVLASATATNGAPSGAAGIDANMLRIRGALPKNIRVTALSTAGSGTMTVSLRLWHRLGALGWVTTQALNASSAAPHLAVAIPETGTDTIGFSERVETVEAADRYYLEIVAIAGTSTAVRGQIAVGR